MRALEGVSNALFFYLVRLRLFVTRALKNASLHLDYERLHIFRQHELAAARFGLKSCCSYRIFSSLTGEPFVSRDVFQRQL